VDQVKDQWLRLAEVAEILRVSERTIRRLIQDGHFIVLPVRGSLRIQKSSVDKYIIRQINLYAQKEGLPNAADRDSDI
jgi:excisionase family DNA binding protein